MAATFSRRLSVVVFNVARNLALPAVNIGLSWIVIFFLGKPFWGEMVGNFIAIGVAGLFMSWGNKEYLLREYSLMPAMISRFWQHSFLTRSLLLVIPVAAFLLIYPWSESLWMCVWLLGGFVAQSLESVIEYTRRYTLALVVELITFLLLAGAVWWFHEQVDALLLLKFLALASGLKGVLLLVWLSDEVLSTSHWRLAPEMLGYMLPFFLIGLSGMLQSKTDLYLVNALVPKEEVGTYHVVVNLWLYSQALAGFMLVPYARNLFRMLDESILRLAINFAVVGIVTILIVFPCIYLLLAYGYDFQLSWDFYLYGALFAWPIFWYLPYIFLMYKHGRERTVMWVNFLGAGINCVFTWWLLHELGVAGALLGSAIAQWLLLITYLLLNRKRVNASEIITS